ncbi:ATP-binding protein [Streptomyces sp. A73]|uniref:ATP-binding protein n=1 Tax=Streptomyces sp. RK75 TaxID=2824895 RepID=UPI001B379CC8|nr:ATP-binding protein [Streptomyces sp. RK75]MBQ0865300.1 ATP-binding protein [Streptomyces sp. RK75]MBQ1157975.1 ATP-binding protein [Streptomyces sp. A73]
MADESNNTTDTYELSFRVPRARRSVPRARAMVRAVLGAWDVAPETAADAELVLSELVTNAVAARAPRDRQVGIRVERRHDASLRVEVGDTNAAEPQRRDPAPGDEGGYGLLLVDALAHRWGTERRACGIGKTVWVQLPAPESEPASEATAAALTVRPGQRVHTHGAWRTVRTVRSEPYATGGLALVLGLDEGPALRVPAATVLALRSGDGPHR